jgi:glycosyltransferase involved in cell wall biosynthesis
VDQSEFDGLSSREELRKELRIPLEETLILYTGHLYEKKGAHILAEVAKLLPTVRVAFVGGTEKHIRDFKKRYGEIKNIKIVGHVPRTRIPKLLRAANVLVLPNSAKTEDSRELTSPMKLFEYMASGVPMVVSDVPAIREVLDERDAFFVSPDSVRALKKGIEEAMTQESGIERAASAMRKVAGFSWERRAERILA